MFLEKLEIQGFKSFANKNVLIFPGMLKGTKRGITAVVGPNGSGKSNVADAVRWALGEQSMKTLRGKKSEDVIFSGSDKKGKLGMAEVSLHLNNEDLAFKFADNPPEAETDPSEKDSGRPDSGQDSQAPIDYSEIVLTRRLYRSGESEYILNNNRARLLDIQMLLAKAKFGQKTYSVIGQGMVEGFLNTSLTERKEFFDEATGVKQYQIKRDDSLNKLRLSHENLVQAQMLLNEIEPRLKSLTRQVNKLKKRGELERELKIIQLDYYSRLWRDIHGQFTVYNSKFLELEKIKFAQEKKLAGFGRDLESIKRTSAQSQAFSKWQADLKQALDAKEEINKKLARLDAQLEVKLEAAGQFDVSFLLQKKGALESELSAAGEEIGSLSKQIGYDREKGGELDGKKAQVDRAIEELNQKIRKFSGQAGGEDFKEINGQLERLVTKLERAESEGELEKIRAILKEIKADIAALRELTSKFGGQDNNGYFKEAHEAMEKLTVAKEAVMVEISDNNLRLTARSERVKLLKEKEDGLRRELDAAEAKLKQMGGDFGIAAAKKEKDELSGRLATIETQIAQMQETLELASAREAKEKDKLFSLQQDMQNLQIEINTTSNQLNELKIHSTRYETKLEDLEIEIREELGGLKEVREKSSAGSTAMDEAAVAAGKEKIAGLKRQLEQIGGIDPQIEQEYNETKERFDFLSGQAGDLKSAIDSLEKIIKELDLTIKERFDKEFKIIEKKFEEYFKILFNGGSAKIIKVMAAEEAEMAAEEAVAAEGEAAGEAKEKKPAEDAELKRIKFLQKHNATGLAGIEIQATPPGKKIKSIAMLSGGERALTAIALICAIISANPSPFVVLDEVDAALDEANSERLAKILDELSHKTQFIVITHNRASMRRANILYGVTMGDDGVSKLLSIKLDDLPAQAGAAKAVRTTD
ncbi:MAG: AAA family ATPase [Planctomycetes bacterium]|nr:AAA family ATPase [Planctomycetota bacterium]